MKNRNILDNPEVDDDLDLHHNVEEDQPESKGGKNVMRRRKRKKRGKTKRAKRERTSAP